MSKTVFLDRDGVLNEDIIGKYITKLNKLKLLPGVIAGLRYLNWAGYRLILVSNQAGIGDKVYKPATLEIVTRRLLEMLQEGGIKPAGIYYCLHGKSEGCGCRKPGIGLFQRAALDFKIDKTRSYFIGDKLSDVQAGQAFGVKVIMVRTGHGVEEAKKIGIVRPDFLVDNFFDAVEIILRREPSVCQRL